MVPNSSHWVLVNLRDYPSYHVGLSHAHGHFGARLKHAGWDGMVVRGASQQPVYLWIENDRVELRDATPYWGMDTFETQRRMKLELGDPLQISVACIGPGGENLGIDDPGVALALTGMVDGLGLDGGEVPRNIAMVMEGYHSGRLTREQVDGLDLTWGNYEAVVTLLEKTIRREGIGAALAKPPRECGRDLGIEDLAVHMKGTGFNYHDMRIHPGMIFQSLIAGAGPVWQTELGLVNPPKAGAPDLGYAYIDPTNPEGMVEPIYKGQLKKLWEDTLGVCHFALKRIPGTWGPAIQALSSAVGWEDYTREEALRVGERLVNVQRLIALYLGYKL
jgi:aldehyde:ferredoxin oxidoreductase